MTSLELTERELTTILSALYYYRTDVEDDGELFDFGDFATNGGRFAPMGAEEIETLAERITSSRAGDPVKLEAAEAARPHSISEV